jgi:hypothetical protein
MSGNVCDRAPVLSYNCCFLYYCSPRLPRPRLPGGFQPKASRAISLGTAQSCPFTTPNFQINSGLVGSCPHEGNVKTDLNEAVCWRTRGN